MKKISLKKETITKLNAVQLSNAFGGEKTILGYTDVKFCYNLSDICPTGKTAA